MPARYRLREGTAGLLRKQGGLWREHTSTKSLWYGADEVRKHGAGTQLLFRRGEWEFAVEQALVEHEELPDATAKRQPAKKLLPSRVTGHTKASVPLKTLLDMIGARKPRWERIQEAVKDIAANAKASNCRRLSPQDERDIFGSLWA